jgi:cobalamin biosynthesis Mg chelatase CobN
MKLRVVIGVVVAALALTAAVTHPVPAAAASPCWKGLLNDWYDGRIDNTYPLHCYQDALKHLPADVQTYSSAHDDILRALQNARAELRKSGTKVTPNTPVPPAPKPGTKTTGGKKTTTTDSSTTTTTTTQAPGRKPPKGGLPSAVDKVNHSSPSSVPLPLIVLGALALLLVAAGGVGIVAKRRQGR